MAVPVKDSESEYSRSELGLVQTYEDGSFLCNGHYNVTYPERRKEEVIKQDIAMDFVTISRCIVREGMAL